MYSKLDNCCLLVGLCPMLCERFSEFFIHHTCALLFCGWVVHCNLCIHFIQTVQSTFHPQNTKSIKENSIATETQITHNTTKLPTRKQKDNEHPIIVRENWDKWLHWSRIYRHCCCNAVPCTTKGLLELAVSLHDCCSLFIASALRWGILLMST